MKNKSTTSNRISLPPAQNPIRVAQQKAVECLRQQSETQLEWLGAERVQSRWHLPVMDGTVLIDLATGEVSGKDKTAVRPTWQLLVLHYLSIRARPDAQPLTATFASFPATRAYASVYEARVNRRLCATVGRDCPTLQEAAAAIGAQAAPGGDMAFQIRLFPRVPVRLIWYAGDEELPSTCTLLLPANIEAFFCTEDIVVLSESFVSRLSGKSF